MTADYRVAGRWDFNPSLDSGRLGRLAAVGYISDAMTDAESLAELRAALVDGRANVMIASGLSTHLDFPGNSETDNGQFLLIGLAVLAIAYWRGSWTVVGVVALVLVAVYWLYWRKVVARRIRKRFIEKATVDLKPWRKSWDFDGITLSAGASECRSPKGDWRAFAAGLKPASLEAGFSGP